MGYDYRESGGARVWECVLSMIRFCMKKESMGQGAFCDGVLTSQEAFCCGRVVEKCVEKSR